MKNNSKMFDAMCYILLYMLLYFSCGFSALTKSGTELMLIKLILAGVMIFSTVTLNGTIRVNNKALTYCMIIIAIIVIGDFIRIEDFKQTQIIIYTLLTSYFFSICITFDDFAKKYVDIIYFLCFFSLVVYFVFLLSPEFFMKCPIVTNAAGYSAYDIVFCTIYENVGVRNQGIFWEPGAYQTFINLALIIELFYLRRLRKGFMVVCLVTILTTMSTAGYISAFMILYIYIMHVLVDKDARNKKTARNIFYFVTVVGFLIVIFNNVDIPGADRVFGKLEEYFDAGGVNSKEKSTVSVRVDSVIHPLKLFFENPLLGIGHEGSKYLAGVEGYNMDTCTFVNWLSYYGGIAGGAIISMYYTFAKRMSNKIVVRILIFVVIFFITASENYARNTFVLMIGFIAMSNLESREKYEDS